MSEKFSNLVQNHSENPVSCPVCHNLLQEPQFLPECNHSLCFQCLQLSVPQNLRKPGDCVAVTCVVCEKVSNFETDVNNKIKENKDYGLDGITVLLPKLTIKERQQKPNCFNFHECGHSAKYYCETDLAWMCEECNQVHHSGSLHKIHNLIPYTEIEFYGPAFCRDHPVTTPVWCTPCSRCVCRECHVSAWPMHVSFSTEDQIRKVLDNSLGSSTKEMLVEVANQEKRLIKLKEDLENKLKLVNEEYKKAQSIRFYCEQRQKAFEWLVGQAYPTQLLAQDFQRTFMDAKKTFEQAVRRCSITINMEKIEESSKEEPRKDQLLMEIEELKKQAQEKKRLSERNEYMKQEIRKYNSSFRDEEKLVDAKFSILKRSNGVLVSPDQKCVTQRRDGAFQYVLIDENLSSDASWRIKVEKYNKVEDYLFFGITSSMPSRDDPRHEATSFGFDTTRRRFIGGVERGSCRDWKIKKGDLLEITLSYSKNTFSLTHLRTGVVLELKGDEGLPPGRSWYPQFTLKGYGDQLRILDFRVTL